MKQALHTPEGFRDISGENCERMLLLEESLRKTVYSFGYQPIELPSIEFASLYTENGGMNDVELYRFFDRDGNMLSLRPDFTPSVARAAVRYFDLGRECVRLSYLGQTFVNHFNYQGRLRETAQLGAELIGDAGPDADAEVIALVIESLLQAGLSEFQITVGHAGYFEGLAREAGLDGEKVDDLKNLIRNRNRYGVRTYLKEQQIGEEAAEALSALPGLFGSRPVLEKAYEAAPAGVGKEAVLRLMEVYDILKLYGLEQYITFDLGMLGNYMYYTGIIFRGYTYGTGDAIVKGGRYDNLLEQYGQKAPATGFVIVIDQLLTAMLRQGLAIKTMGEAVVIPCDPTNREEAVRKVTALRKKGIRAVLSSAGDRK